MRLLCNARMMKKTIYSVQFFIISVLILQIQETKSEFFESTSSLETNVSISLPRLSATNSLDHEDAAVSTRTTLPTITTNVINENNSSDARKNITQPVIQSAINNATLQAASIAPNSFLQQSDSTEEDGSKSEILKQEIPVDDYDDILYANAQSDYVRKDGNDTGIPMQETPVNDHNDIGNESALYNFRQQSDSAEGVVSDTEILIGTSDYDMHQTHINCFGQPAELPVEEPTKPISESAVVLAAIFISVAIVAYIGLLLWRRMLDKRYGKRHLLVEEDYYDVNDLKFFEL